MLGRLRTPTLLTALVALGTIWRVRSVWDDLPERMASSFGASGQPQALTGREEFFTFFGAVGGAVLLLLLATPGLLRVMPVSLVNLPNREYWLAPERRADSLRRLGLWTAWVAVPLALFMAVALELVIRAALERSGLANGLFLAAMGLFVLVSVGMAVGLMRAFTVR